MDLAERRKLMRTRIVLSVFGLLAVVLVVFAVWLPPLMREMAVEACNGSGGSYDRERAVCVRD